MSPQTKYPFKFNGKELDDETGNYYYGARYYNPKWSIWISVDPLAEKTMDPLAEKTMDPYGYCYNNPIRLIDPDGRAPTDDYKLLQNGKLKLIRSTTDKFDRIFATTKDNIIRSKNYIEVYGMRKIYDYKGRDFPDNSGREERIQVINFSDSYNGRKYYEFAAKNTISEHGFLEYNKDHGDCYNEASTVFTNRGTDIMFGGSLEDFGLIDAFIENGLNISESSHSHNTEYSNKNVDFVPSGFDPITGVPLPEDEQWGDIEKVKDYKEEYPNQKMIHTISEPQWRYLHNI